jgi:hypothetical protein
MFDHPTPKKRPALTLMAVVQLSGVPIGAAPAAPGSCEVQ